MRPAFRTSAAVAALLAGALVAQPAFAAKVGVATAVNPDAFSGGGNSTISIGKSIFYNERVRTSGGGLVQVLLVDGSAFTVGPNSDLVIDKFVYDPNQGKGEMVASFSKGVLRFVGGKLSKSAGGVNIKTPAGALAVRGGIVQAQVGGNRGRFSFVFGDEMVLRQSGGNTLRVFTTGYTIDLLAGFNNAFTRPTTPEDNAFFLQQFAGKPGTDGGSNGGGPSNGQVEQGMAGVNSNAFPPDIRLVEIGNTQLTTVDKADFTTDLIQGEIAEQLGQQLGETPPENTNPPPENTNPPPENTNPRPEPPPPPPQDEVRVLTSNALYPSIFEIFDTSQLGGDPFATADDFETDFQSSDGFLTATVSGLTASEIADDDGEGDEPTVNTVPLPPVILRIEEADQSGASPVSGTVTIGDASPQTFIGSAFLNDGFFAYRLFRQSEGVERNSQILAIGGPAYQPITRPSGVLREFQLYTDPRENLGIAFASEFTAPEIVKFSDNDFVMRPLGGEGASVSKLLLLEQDNSGPNDQSRAVWLQSSFVIAGSGSDQESAIVIALGGMHDGGLIGDRRGGSQTNAGSESELQRSYSFTGGIATIAGANGSHFLGNDNPNIVIGTNTTGTVGANLFLDQPLDPSNEATPVNIHASYHVGSQTGTSSGVTQTLGELKGYAAGAVLSEIPASGFVNQVRNLSPDQVALHFNALQNTMSAEISVDDVGSDVVQSYNLNFGDVQGGTGNSSAYLDNAHFGAFEREGSAVITNEGTPAAFTLATSYLISSDAIEANSQLFSDGKRAFCQSCDFIKWGAWGTRVAFGGSQQGGLFDNIHLAWWVAGDVTPAGQLPVTGSATYSGDAIGSVVNGGRQYTATGDMELAWSFAQRSGTLDIRNFDDRSFSANVASPTLGPAALNRFSGPWTGEGLGGGATGSFVGNSPNNPAAGVIGNFNYSQSGYQATGIFGGTRAPVGN